MHEETYFHRNLHKYDNASVTYKINWGDMLQGTLYVGVLPLQVNPISSYYSDFLF